jgi:hypothetical protein
VERIQSSGCGYGGDGCGYGGDGAVADGAVANGQGQWAETMNFDYVDLAPATVDTSGGDYGTGYGLQSAGMQVEEVQIETNLLNVNL